MTEPRTPGFGDAAAGALAPVAGQVAKAREQALAGTLRIDMEAASAILGQLGALRLRAGDLVGACAELDTPLRFGANWVGRLVSERLRAVAAGGDGAVTPVLATFHRVLDDLEATVRFAAGMYETADQQAEADLRRAVGTFGVRIEERR
jgi:hypothetical protein